MRGVFLDVETLDRNDLELQALRDSLPDWVFYPQTAPQQVVERLAGADVVVTNKVVLSADVLRACPSLRLIAVAATGTNNVDLDIASAQGIVVCNVRGYATASVVQHTFALLLALVTRLPQYQQAVARGDWVRSNMFCLLDYPIRELAGMTLGIVGYGVLGQAVSHVAQAFGMHVLIAQRPDGASQEGRIPLDRLLPQIDVLSLHCPLTPATHGLIGASQLAQIKPGALLINTARGGIVDETALIAALRSGQLGGAALDVIGCEPPPGDYPLLSADVPNLIVTPHIAWASRQARQRLVDQLVENVRSFVAGRPRNTVNEPCR